MSTNSHPGGSIANLAGRRRPSLAFGWGSRKPAEELTVTRAFPPSPAPDRLDLVRPEPAPRRPTALLVGANPIETGRLAAWMRSLGYRVIAHTDPHDALNGLSESAPDLMVLDSWVGPLDTLGFLDLAEQARPNITATTVAALDDGDDRRAALLRGRVVAATLVRPFGREDLNHAVSLAPLPELPDSALTEVGDATAAKIQTLLDEGPQSNGAKTKRGRTARRSETLLPPGEVIDGRFIVQGFLGAGGMATVYEVEDSELGETVALKLMATAPDVPDADERFRQEMRILRTLRHPHLVQTFDFGSWGGRLYYTMELLRGKTVGAALSEAADNRAPTAIVVRVMRQVALAVAAAHARGVIHRDLKPDNMFLLEDSPAVKVMDFGIAKTLGSEDSVFDGILGTPYYIAPELFRQMSRPSPASDLYALGVVMYRMVTGRQPFSGANSLGKLVVKICKDDPVAPSEIVDLPPALEALIMALLDKRPEHRPESAAVLAELLARVDTSDRFRSVPCRVLTATRRRRWTSNT